MRVDVSLRRPLRKWSRRAGRYDSLVGLIWGGSDVRQADEPCGSIVGSSIWSLGEAQGVVGGDRLDGAGGTGEKREVRRNRPQALRSVADVEGALSGEPVRS